MKISNLKRGDVVLVDFPFPEEAQARKEEGKLTAMAWPLIQGKIPSSAEPILFTTCAPIGLNFGNQQFEKPSSQQTIVLQNVGNAPLVIHQIIANGDYTQTNNYASPLPPQASCLVNIIFTPKNGGYRTGLLTIRSNAHDSPHTIYLVGHGLKLRPAVVVSGSTIHSSTQNVLLVPISSTPNRSILPTDYEINEESPAFRLAKLSRRSWVKTSNLATVRGSDIKEQLGQLPTRDLVEVDKRLKMVLTF